MKTRTKRLQARNGDAHMKNALINSALLISVSFFALTLLGCSTNTQQQNTGIGAVSGAVVGGLAGSLIGGGTGQAVAIGVGAVAGALVGGYIGHSMDSSDNQTLTQAMNNNRTNQSSTWTNNKTGARYTVKPTSNFMAYNGSNYCRKYYTSATVQGKTETHKGIACKQSNGTWKSIG